MENENVILDKSYNFALRIIKVYKFLNTQKKFILSKQLLRSGTSIGANITEAQEAISKKDFKNKMFIALKEAAESRYWVKLLKDSEYLTQKQAKSLLDDLEEIIKILSKIVKNAN
ncbi:four helix bundle protein [Caminibacter mediatlanticus TB-2]|uniref:Four helix bundle protein n=1 Tax=Caminibacter mediatlanticus TB-2 TaxID=391592 RepID=A0ABX5V9E4_9BACT|nr:four helix bundle protein [Caminibacter mediatlanticus]QCT93972.1 four helix bundle protein [Caminibacter mediatlanticus TB-2]